MQLGSHFVKCSWRVSSLACCSAATMKPVVMVALRHQATPIIVNPSENWARIDDRNGILGSTAVRAKAPTRPQAAFPRCQQGCQERSDALRNAPKSMNIKALQVLTKARGLAAIRRCIVTTPCTASSDGQGCCPCAGSPLERGSTARNWWYTASSLAIIAYFKRVIFVYYSLQQRKPPQRLRRAGTGQEFRPACDSAGRWPCLCRRAALRRRSRAR